MNSDSTIFVVDDDEAVRKAVASAGAILGCKVESYENAADFLSMYHPARPGCLVLDIKLPGISGLELQRKLSDEDVCIPIITISGHADVRIAVESMTLGAITLLEKPFSLDELLGYLRQALEKDRQFRLTQNQSLDWSARLENLTPKERDVLRLIAGGKTNREIAETLGLSVRAIEDRRARLMKKVGVKTLPELIQFMSAIPENFLRAE